MTLNEPLAMEAAQALARRVLIEGGSNDEERVTNSFRLCVTRPPTEAERDILLNLLEKQRRRFADGWANPSEVATGKTGRPDDLPPGTTPTQLGAYTVVARVLLNLDETITKE
jgi:hypothetical protein